MDDTEGWRERVRDICADGATWWWWWQSFGGSLPQTKIKYGSCYMQLFNDAFTASFARFNESTCLKRWVIIQSAYFCISYWLGLPGIMFMSLPVPFSIITIPFTNYWYIDIFKVAQFFNLYINVLAFTYFIILLDWYAINSWHWHIN